ncbi:hypothetical protein PG988_011432 [Apiospora saccharicola]
MAAKSDAADNDDKCITNHIAAPFRTPPQLSTFLEMVIGTDSIVGIDIILVIPGPYPPYLSHLQTPSALHELHMDEPRHFRIGIRGQRPPPSASRAANKNRTS